MTNVFITYNPGGVAEAPPIKREKPMGLEGKIPGWLWHDSCREGRIIKEEGEYIRLVADGWVESPSKINKVEPIIKGVLFRDYDITNDQEVIRFAEEPKVESKPKPKPKKRRRKINGYRSGTTQSKP